jgi:hypothetical protein
MHTEFCHEMIWEGDGKVNEIQVYLNFLNKFTLQKFVYYIEYSS